MDARIKHKEPGVYIARVRDGGLGRASVEVTGKMPMVESWIPIAEAVGLVSEGDIVLVQYTNDGELPVIIAKIDEDDLKAYYEGGTDEPMTDDSKSNVTIGVDGAPEQLTADQLIEELMDEMTDMPKSRNLIYEAVEQAVYTNNVGGLHILFGYDEAMNRQMTSEKIREMMLEGATLDTIIQMLIDAGSDSGDVSSAGGSQNMEWPDGSI